MRERLCQFLLQLISWEIRSSVFSRVFHSYPQNPSGNFRFYDLRGCIKARQISRGLRGSSCDFPRSDSWFPRVECSCLWNILTSRFLQAFPRFHFGLFCVFKVQTFLGSNQKGYVCYFILTCKRVFPRT